MRNNEKKWTNFCILSVHTNTLNCNKILFSWLLQCIFCMKGNKSVSSICHIECNSNSEKLLNSHVKSIKNSPWKGFKTERFKLIAIRRVRSNNLLFVQSLRSHLKMENLIVSQHFGISFWIFLQRWFFSQFKAFFRGCTKLIRELRLSFFSVHFYLSSPRESADRKRLPDFKISKNRVRWKDERCGREGDSTGLVWQVTERGNRKKKKGRFEE